MAKRPVPRPAPQPDPALAEHPLFQRLASATAPASQFFDRKLLAVDDAARTVHLHFHAPPQSANIRGDVQGGFVAAMLDTAAGTAMVMVLPKGGFTVTLDLNVSYMRPVPLGELIGVGHLLHHGGAIGFTEAELLTPAGELVARATATMRIFHHRTPDPTATA